ncbi:MULTISPECIES: tryptophan halogenase family protein [unclassified Pseudoalteromonas]|uniref:tryptophan halogenase family protein n=1 Tax=unclassified Pseudoalteromonas TaxID=194690 RepID=UPI0005A6690C|nr:MULTISPECIES: tryptophan halogenase family protein [unclassified Pseudoalteromonas]
MQNKKIIVLGGGTAGWMSALIFAHAWIKKEFEITLIESKDIPVIGVGEGSTPALKTFFKKLNIAESEWMGQCNATYKTGITFNNWSTKPGFESYFHPFPSQLDDKFTSAFYFNTQMRRKGSDVVAHPNDFFFAHYLAKNNLAPIADYNFPFETEYGYHFDSHLLGQFLKNKALAMGVKYQQSKISSAELKPDGNIKHLISEDSQIFQADFFIDCSGFNATLIDKTLKVPFVDYSNLLFNNAGVAISTPKQTILKSETTSSALKNGWAWKIPLTNRTGNGYVYSTDFCSPDLAETELRSQLNLLDSDVEAKHLKMKVGRRESHWYKNCLCIGLSQGFIEPLEATALFLVQQTAAIFVDEFEKGQFTPKNQIIFNANINQYFDGIRDYIVTHYKTNSRKDTQYWRENAANPHLISDSLKNIYSCWGKGENLTAQLNRQNVDKYYTSMSWHCLLSGMGLFPDSTTLQRPQPHEVQIRMDSIKSFYSRCALNYKTQNEFLEKR